MPGPARTELERRPEKTKYQNHVLYFVQEGRQQELARKLRTFQRLLGSEAFYHPSTGEVLYRTWQPMRRKDRPPEGHVLLSKLSPRADPYAPNTRYTKWRRMQIHEVTADDGDARAAIRNMDHIIIGILERDPRQAAVVQARVSKLLDLFRDFSNISNRQFQQLQQNTYELLRHVGLDPDTVLDQERARMATLLLKGSGGHDTTGRINKLISLMALSAAFRRATLIEKGWPTRTVKFTQMREALVLTRNFDRAMFFDAAKVFRPRVVLAASLFQHPNKPAYDSGYLAGVVDNAVFQLDQTHLRPWRTVANQVIPIASQIRDLLRVDDRRTILTDELIERVHTPLAATLRDHQEIYPSLPPSGVIYPPTQTSAP